MLMVAELFLYTCVPLAAIRPPPQRLLSCMHVSVTSQKGRAGRDGEHDRVGWGGGGEVLNEC